MYTSIIPPHVWQLLIIIYDVLLAICHHQGGVWCVCHHHHICYSIAGHIWPHQSRPYIYILPKDLPLRLATMIYIYIYNTLQIPKNDTIKNMAIQRALSSHIHVYFFCFFIAIFKYIGFGTALNLHGLNCLIVINNQII